MKRLTFIVAAILLLPSPAHASSPEPPFTPPSGWLYLQYGRPTVVSDYRFNKWLYATYYPGDLVAETAAAVREAEWIGCRLFELDSALFLERSGTAWQLSYWCRRGIDEIAVMWMLADQGESQMLVYSTTVGQAPPPVPTILEMARATPGEMGVLATAPAPSGGLAPGISAAPSAGSSLGSWTNPTWLLIPASLATMLLLEVRRRRLVAEAEAPALGGAAVRVASESAVPPAAP